MMNPEASFQEIKEHFFNRLDFSEESKILDAGCMDSMFYNFFLDVERERNDKLFKSFVGIDLLEGNMETLSNKFKGSRADFQYGDLAGDLPFPEKHFDMTFCTGTLHHIDFDLFIQVIEGLFFLTKKHLVFNLLHFEDESLPRELCVHTQTGGKVEYYVHRAAEAEEVICQVAKKVSNGTFQKKSYPGSSMVSRMILGQPGKILSESIYLFDLHSDTPNAV
ncbi:MAG: hypothetical protein ACI9S8_003229 [Chlamydiales bacterium]|jgi:hypothetical protein